MHQQLALTGRQTAWVRSTAFFLATQEPPPCMHMHTNHHPSVLSWMHAHAHSGVMWLVTVSVYMYICTMTPSRAGLYEVLSPWCMHSRSLSNSLAESKVNNSLKSACRWIECCHGTSMLHTSGLLSQRFIHLVPLALGTVSYSYICMPT
jgi:hypothetical protein